MKIKDSISALLSIISALLYEDIYVHTMENYNKSTLRGSNFKSMKISNVQIQQQKNILYLVKRLTWCRHN